MLSSSLEEAMTRIVAGVENRLIIEVEIGARIEETANEETASEGSETIIMRGETETAVKVVDETQAMITDVGMIVITMSVDRITIAASSEGATHEVWHLLQL
jgi:hypothetical protein